MRFSSWLLRCSIFLSLIAVGCGSGIISLPALQASFSSTASTIEIGGKTTLTWQTENATSVTITGTSAALASNGDMEVAPTTTTTYTMTATGSGQQLIRTATIVVVPPPPPPTAQLQASVATIETGQSATLSWITANADSVSIDQGVGTVAMTGSTVVSPAQTATYTLTASADGKSATSSVTIIVLPAPIALLQASAATIQAGQSATLSWTSTNASSIVIDQGIGAVTAAGSTSVSPAQTTIFTLTATGNGKTVTSSVTITVLAAPTAQLQTSSSTIQTGSSATLTWTSANATTVSIDQGVGTVAANGSITVSPAQTTTYTLTATGNGKTVTSSVTITVLAGPTAQLLSSAATVQSGQAATLTWTSTNASSVAIDQGIGAVAASGSVVVSPVQTTTYTLTATGNGKTVNSSVTITVAGSPTAQFQVANSLVSGQGTTLIWSTTNATSVSIDQGIGAVATSGNITVNPAQTTTYTLTATGNGKTVTTSVTITVQPAPTGQLSATNTQVPAGQSTNLTWSTANATTISIDQGIGTVAASGSVTVSPTQTTTYTLTATGNGKTVTSSVTITLLAAPTDQLSAANTQLPVGQSTKLTWSTVNATAVSIDQGIGAVAASGSVTVSPVQMTTYTLTATGNGKTVTTSVTIDVLPAPTAQLNVASAQIPSGQSTKLTWSTDDATTVSINQGIGNVATNGSMTVSPAQTTTYTLTATGNGKTVTASVTLTVLPAPTAQLQLESTSIDIGQSTQLTWSSTNATTVSIDQGIGTVAASGSMTVSPTTTTTYTMTVVGNGKTITTSATLTVLPAPTDQFSATATTITSGQSTKLNWSSTNAKTVSIDQGVGTVAATGSKTVSPAVTTTYTLTATGNGKTVTTSVTITVLPAPSAQLNASQTTINAGQSTQLNWSSANATTISINQGIGAVAASGSSMVSPAQTTNYTLTATGNGVTVTSSVTVTVIPVPLPTANVSAAPSSIESGLSTTLSWTSSNATSVTISQGIGSVKASGSKIIMPSQTTTYTLTATSQAGSVTSAVTVNVWTPAPTLPTPLTGVLGWKGNTRGSGRYDSETTLTPANVNSAQFGKVREITTDGGLLPQPLYVRSVDLGAKGVHDLLIAATENDSVYAFDGQSTSQNYLWQRNFLNPSAGITVQTDNHGGRSSFGGEIGITGTPVVDPQTGVLYVVTASQQNGVVTDTLHAIDIRTGLDANAGSAVISATVPGTGEGSVNGQLAFSASQENQRPGLVLSNGVLYIAFGSFSDFAPFHGWLFAYNTTTLQQLGVFNSSPNYRADFDKGSGAAYWNGGASPVFENDGSFYIVAANGSTDAENGGQDYGDTVLHLSFANGQFTVLDWFIPYNRDCIDASDIEVGSGGFALLPDEVGNGRPMGVVLSKEGRLYLLDRTNLGHFNASGDQVVQQFMVGQHACDKNTTGAAADGPIWNRLYGNASYWNGNFYMAASNLPIVQYSISGTAINQTPVATGATATGLRGGNTVVSANGLNNGITWMYEKARNGNAILHAYDATNVSNEFWNSQMQSNRDALTTGGEGFQVPVVIDGKVIVTSGQDLVVYKVLQ